MHMHVLSEWIRRQRERAELEGLPRDALDHIARDIGVGTSDLEQLVERGHDPHQLPGMLKALGLDEAAVARAEPAMLRDMQRLCSFCEATGVCRESLDAGIAATSYRDFCINAPTLDALREAKGRLNKGMRP